MQTRQLEIIILAAGLGQRFEQSGGKGHKALAPVWDSRGTLQLLLNNLSWIIANKNVLITIVTGRFDKDIAAATTPHGIRQVHNPLHADETLLQSIARACSDSPATSWLILFADTLYSKQSLETLVKVSLLHASESESETEVTALVAVSPILMIDGKSSKVETHVSINPNGEILDFNNPDADWQMAHAVVWPRRFLPYLLDATQARYADRQWQVLQFISEATSRPAAKAIRLTLGATYDIDTINDLHAIQHQHRIQPYHLEYFQRHVSKERSFNSQRDSLSGVIYQKQCESVEAAKQEFLMMQRLYSQRPDLLVKPIKLSARCLEMGFAAGIRLYDLMRHLPGHPRETAIRTILLNRCIDRLRDMQDFMMTKSETMTSAPYPFDSKVIDLLKTLTELIGVPFTPEIKSELAFMQIAWNALCVIPFRDATPKNIVVGIESLSPLIHSNERARRLSEILKKDDVFWQEVPLIDIDFTSTRELTTPEDDVISLLAHGMTFRPEHVEVASQPLLTTFNPSLQRCDLTWFVRYLRFGGRKLLYKLLNPRGFNVRFRYDEPSFYFEQLPQRLSEDFKVIYPNTFQLLLQLRDYAERYRGYFPDQGVHDPFLASFDSNQKTLEHYWQESPLEWIAQHA
jgi:hypothetical protein